MFPLKTSLATALLSVVVTAGGLYYFHQGRLREAHHLQRQNNQMRSEANQRYQSRMATPLRATSVELTSPARETATVAKAAMTGVKPAEYYRNEGSATPLATLQTFAWACDRGDSEQVGRLLHIDASARQKAEAFVASLPKNVREQWRTVDEMAAAVLTRSTMASPFPDAEILATATVEPINAGRVRLRLPDTPKDRTEYQQTVEGWKYVLTERMVDDYVKQAGAQPHDVRR